MIENSKEKNPHKEGRPWENCGTYSKYDLVLEAKNKLQEELPTHDVKIKLLEKGFRLKTRLKQTVLDEEKKLLVEQEKMKKENKKLNKQLKKDLDNQDRVR